jgi:hypothetical protein
MDRVWLCHNKWYVEHNGSVCFTYCLLWHNQILSVLHTVYYDMTRSHLFYIPFIMNEYETDRIYVCHSQWYVHQIGSGYVIISGMQNKQDLYPDPICFTYRLLWHDQIPSHLFYIPFIVTWPDPVCLLMNTKQTEYMYVIVSGMYIR